MDKRCKWSVKNPLASKSYGAVKRAIDGGILRRPKRCERCGREPCSGSDGRSLIQAHHHNGHDKQLEVQWLCPRCHHIVDGNCGSTAPGAKLTEEDVREILFLVDAGFGCVTLGSAYGVSKYLIRDISRGRQWSHV